MKPGWRLIATALASAAIAEDDHLKGRLNQQAVSLSVDIGEPTKIAKARSPRAALR
jgi:hypothetical protein